MRGRLIYLILAWLTLSASEARAAAAAPSSCTLNKLAEFPVTMVGMRPMISAKINGQEVRLFIDSGAFFSTISADGAKRLGLPLSPAPFGFQISGAGGRETPSIATAKSFEVGPFSFANAEFLTSPRAGLDSGGVGLLGQNLLNAADIEYDLANGVVRLIRPGKGCGKAPRAYWAQTYSEVEIEPTDNPLSPQIIAKVTVNGHQFRAMFDTGAGMSAMSLLAATRIGVTAQSKGAVSAGNSGGFGPRRFETWTAPVDSFSIGDETVKNTRLRFGDMELNRADMLIGPDFFLSHRIYVAKDQNKIYVTYNGGPVFNLASGASTSAPSTAPPRADAQPPAQAAPIDADGFSRRAAASVSRRDFAGAIADYSRAVELEPKVAKHLYDRAVARLDNRQPVLAMADLGEALRLQPDYPEALVTRGALYLTQRDEARARPDFEAALKLQQPGVPIRLTIAAAYERMSLYEAAIGHYDKWIEEHPKDQNLANVLNSRCRARALWNHELDKALADCDAALRMRPHTANFLDSRGLVRLRLGQFDQAIADYDEALKLQPKQAWSLYARGLAKQGKALKADAAADMAAAVAMDATVAARSRQYGLTPAGSGPASTPIAAGPSQPPPPQPKLPIVIQSPNANPGWLIRPSYEQTAFYYPERAQRLSVAGNAVVQCKVAADGAVTDCSVVEENPVDFGFGAAAIKLLTAYAQFSPKIAEGHIVAGASIKVPIAFSTAPRPAPAAP
ncbi:MAG TPA: TonB family protein [Caulobacteraceae bacterium]|jgi:TonB family protein|nr:TonB family protein [Caulobacteraceae bacterium]